MTNFTLFFLDHFERELQTATMNYDVQTFVSCHIGFRGSVLWASNFGWVPRGISMKLFTIPWIRQEKRSKILVQRIPIFIKTLKPFVCQPREECHELEKLDRVLLSLDPLVLSQSKENRKKRIFVFIMFYKLIEVLYCYLMKSIFMSLDFGLNDTIYQRKGDNQKFQKCQFVW
jgi:hypothetical protein